MGYYTANIDQRSQDIRNFLETHSTWIHNNHEFWQQIDQLKPDAHILDAGCGGGLLASQMIEKKQFKNVELADYADYRTAENTQTLPFHSIDFSFDTFPFDDRTFDVVLSIQVLEHLENPFNYIRQITRTLKDNGLLILCVPNGWSFFSKLLFLKHGLLDGYTPQNDHISFYSKDIFFKRLLTDYQVIKKIYHPRKRIPFPLLRHFKFPYPACEFFSRKMGFVLKKNS